MHRALTVALAAALVSTSLPAFAQDQGNGSGPVVSLPPPASDAVHAGYRGMFYVTDDSGNYRLYLQGRAQIDSYNYFGKGIPDTTLKSTVFLRRIRPEITGEILKRWQFMFAGDFGQTDVDNGKGLNPAARGSPSDPAARFGSAQTPSVKAAPTDVFVNYRADGLLNVQVGQFDAPFTLENRTSDKYIPFMERSLAVRALGIPTNKELGGMLWGETGNKLLFYSAGVFNGDGQNRPGMDNRVDTMGRVFVHPLVGVDKALKDVQLGGSFRWGQRDKSYVYYDYASMTTQGNFKFWNPVYKSAAVGGVDTYTHVIPAGSQLGLAAELRVPIGDIFDLTSELVYVKNQTREALEGYEATNTERFGDLHGYAYYVQAGFWPLGQRDINGTPGYENPTHLDLKKPVPSTPPQALQILVKWEQLNTTYNSASRSGTPDSKNIDGKIKVNALSLGANYWATKHIRLSANYVLNAFPGSKGDATSDQRAMSPANQLKKGINDDARDNAHFFHELLFRVAVAL
ncbi:MAG: hypothetical protein HY898_22555 [Deltaproteobacteria bacterium]|nr:hypothetical protein [Deltaproteobacteria bacterium]